MGPDDNPHSHSDGKANDPADERVARLVEIRSRIDLQNLAVDAHLAEPVDVSGHPRRHAVLGPCNHFQKTHGRNRRVECHGHARNQVDIFIDERRHADHPLPFRLYSM